MLAEEKVKEVGNVPTVFITEEAHRLMEFYVNNCKEEISGLGEVEIIDGKFVIQNIFLLKQKVSGAATDIDENGVAEFLEQYITGGGNPEKLKLWWHSHARMGTFWSSTDEDQCKDFQNDWMISIVTNHKGEFRCRIDWYTPIRFTLDKVDLDVYNKVNYFSDEQTLTLLNEIEEKVEKNCVPWNKGVVGYVNGSKKKGGQFTRDQQVGRVVKKLLAGVEKYTTTQWESATERAEIIVELTADNYLEAPLLGLTLTELRRKKAWNDSMSGSDNSYIHAHEEGEIIPT